MHKGWYSRGYLPHFDAANLIQMVTFRLEDALPIAIVAEWERQLTKSDGAINKIALLRRCEKYLDAGYGSCCLRDCAVAQIVEDALLYFDNIRYRMLAWVVMPNHVHTLLEVCDGFTLAGINHSWKSFTAHEIKPLHDYGVHLWQRDSFDRFIRNERHFHRAVHYIHMNPVKAGLCRKPEDWRFSSAYKGNKLPGSAAVPAA
jgi:putative DNA methylase